MINGVGWRLGPFIPEMTNISVDLDRCWSNERVLSNEVVFVRLIDADLILQQLRNH